MARVVFVFVDGLGLGDPDSPENPLRHPDLSVLANFRPRGWEPPPDGDRPPSLPEVLRTHPLPFPGTVVATDPSLGLPGLPQSATGQTTLLTGKNAALVLGHHHYGVPTPTLQRMLMAHSVMKTLVRAGRSAAFLNAFRPLFFELGESVWSKGMSATTWANRAAGLPFCSLADLQAERAVYQDITHDSLRARGVKIDLREPERAGEIIARRSDGFDLTLFEFFQTDKAGHAQDPEKAERELLKLERFLRSLLGSMDLSETTFLLTSDHGNVEDLGTKMHTHNPVPTVVIGARAAEIAPGLDRLERFTPVILQTLEVDAS